MSKGENQLNSSPSIVITSKEKGNVMSETEGKAKEARMTKFIYPCTDSCQARDDVIVNNRGKADRKYKIKGKLHNNKQIAVDQISGSQYLCLPLLSIFILGILDVTKGIWDTMPFCQQLTMREAYFQHRFRVVIAIMSDV